MADGEKSTIPELIELLKTDPMAALDKMGVPRLTPEQEAKAKREYAGLRFEEVRARVKSKIEAGNAMLAEGVFPTVADAVKGILHIIDNEASAHGAVVAREKGEKKKISSEAVVSARLSGHVFRITLSWVWDRSKSQAGRLLGTGYIETDWDLRLEPLDDSIPIQPPFVWRVFPSDRGIRKSSHPDILDEKRLRALIRQKLGVELHP